MGPHFGGDLDYRATKSRNIFRGMSAELKDTAYEPVL
jgi:hypothetical protein